MSIRPARRANSRVREVPYFVIVADNGKYLRAAHWRYCGAHRKYTWDLSDAWFALDVHTALLHAARFGLNVRRLVAYE